MDDSKIEASASIQPNLIVAKEGEEYSVTHVTPGHTFKVTFVPGQVNDWDLFASGDVAEVILK